MDRAALEHHLQETRNRIAEGERRISRQWKIIQELERDSHNPRSARKLLDRLLQVQEAHIDLRDDLIKMLEAEEPQTPEGV
jgi:uncharacterized protein YutE (UPF0331/DUF86 family)